MGMGSRHLGVGVGAWEAEALQQGHGRRMTVATSGAVQSVVPNFSQAAGQNVLEEPFDKLPHREPDPFDLLGSVVPIAKGDLALLQAFQARVGDSDAEHVAAQIIEHFLAPAGMLSMHDPFLAPGLGGDLEQQTGVLDCVSDLGSKHFGQSLDWKQELGIFRRQPLLAVERQTSGADQKVRVRVVEHGAGPGMQHPH